MSIRFQKRVEIAKGTGVNLSKSGASVSHRTKFGSIGTSGFSIRTGIPGLSFQKRWGGKKDGTGLIILFFVILFWIFAVIARVAFNLLVWGYYKIKERRENKKKSK